MATSNKHLSVAKTLKPIQSDTTTELAKLYYSQSALSNGMAITTFAAGECFRSEWFKGFEIPRL
jgi:hypothetical protein